MTGLKTSERSFTTWDGVELFYRAWESPRSDGPPNDKAVLLFHRGHEHSGRLQGLAEGLALEGFTVFAWDQRGHGRSPGERGWAENLAVVVKDVDAFVRHLSDSTSIPVENMAAVAYSVGSVVLSAWVHDYAPPLGAMVLGTPALRVKLYVPFALAFLRLKSRLVRKSFIKSYVKSKMLTHDPEMAREYDADPLISRQIAVNILIDLYDTSTRLLADAGAIRVPTLVLGAGSDWVVRLSAEKEFVRRLGAPVKAIEVYDGFFHAVFHEKERAKPIARTREFILHAFEQPPASRASLLAADREGYTREEFDRLRRPLPLLSPRRWGFAFQRLLLKTLGRLSEGIRLGWTTGFDSGSSLDYVYENRPRGISFLGRSIDRAYLDSVGWKGIRQRKRNLQAILERAIEAVARERRSVHVVDVAAGPGRYLLETVKKLSHIPIVALLRDRDRRGLEAGRSLALQMGLTNATYAEGDAFDADSLASITPRPDIAIASGVYELFSDNERIVRSLSGLHRALPKDGRFIYTNQPWHPELEMIARVLVNRDGEPWIMRRRTQAEMDELVRAAGFRKVAMEVDEWGIFTVSLAEKAVR